MKKYKVSLALKIPSNFEIEIKAKTERKAIEEAIEKFIYRKSNEDNIVDPLWEFIDLDIKQNDMDALDSGVYIEEIE